MTFFRDLSPYEYGSRWGGVAGAQNVGWLADGRPFETASPMKSDLDLIWAHCKVAIHPTRGFHSCDICKDLSLHPPKFTRNNETLLLGYSEIRVISRSGQSYAAPSLIYHYILEHNYRPPKSFMSALRSGPTPPSDAYFLALTTRELSWSSTSQA